MQFESKVKNVFSDLFKVDENKINKNSSLVDDLGADSLDRLELLSAFEKRFDIEIKNEEASEIRTVGDAITFLKTKLKNVF